MRVLHLSTFDEVGGAARSAMRLHRGLRALAVDSSMLVRTKTSACEHVHACTASEQLSAPFWRAVQARYIDRRRTKVSNSLFTAGYPGRDIANDAATLAPDLLHAHWVWNFLTPVTLARAFRLGLPVVWTFHDKRALSGGCHFSAGCDGFRFDCSHCPQLSRDRAHLPRRNLSDQINLWPAAEMTVVAPSEWMANEVRSSRVFAPSRVEVIPYGLETDLFFPLPQAEARGVYSVPTDTFCILFGAESGVEQRKGAAILVDALSRFFAQLPPEVPALCLSFGAPNPEFEKLGVRHRSLGLLKGHEALRAAYSAADVFVLPSLEDTLPNTMLEALACGRAVLSFEGTGGARETLVAPGAGWTVPTGDAVALATELTALFRDRQRCFAAGRAGRERVLKHHTLEAQATRHRELYASLVPPKSKRPSAIGGIGPNVRAALPALALDILTPG